MPTNGHHSKIVSTTAAAKLCNVSRATLWRWIKNGDLKAARTAGGHYRISMDDLITFTEHKIITSRNTTDPHRKRVFVLDSDPQIIKEFQRFLSDNDFDMDYGCDGFEAGVKIMAFNPDVVVVDLVLPHVDGLDICFQLRRNPDLKHVKIVAISDFDSEHERQKSMDCGADMFFAKPLDMSDIMDAIKSLT